MPQWWLLLNLDAGETSSWPGTFREFMLNKPLFLVEMLDVNKVTLLEEPATYYWAELKRLTKRSGRKRSRRGIPYIRVPVSAFDRLPAEIVCMIANELTEDCVDCVCFGLTNRRHWSIARGVIEKCLHNIAYLNSYAGDRLMFAGSWMDHDDLPPGIFDEQDLDDLTNEEGYMQHLFLVAEDWPRTKTEVFTHHFVDEGLRSRGVSYICADLYLWVALQGPEFRGHGDYDRHYPSPDNFRILRNLTTNEYVHESALFEWTEKKGVPQSPDSLDRVNLGHICAVRIFWSSDSEFSYKGKETHRGVWAGHCFDIVPEKELLKMERDKEIWKDVSKEVLGEVEELWKYLATTTDDWVPSMLAIVPTSVNE